MKIAFLGSSEFVKPVKDTIARSFELVEKNPELIIVASYGKILSKTQLSTPKYGAINIHPSHLPKYRGPSPIQNQILDGVKESAITFIKMDEEVDHGPILKTIPFEILDNDTFESAAKRAFDTAANALPQVIREFTSGKIELIEQNHSEASYTKLLRKEDGYVGDNPPENLERRIRAYYPWPSVWTKFNGKIVKLLPDSKIQVEGKKLMTYKDFINGYKEGEKFLGKFNLI